MEEIFIYLFLQPHQSVSSLTLLSVPSLPALQLEIPCLLIFMAGQPTLKRNRGGKIFNRVSQYA